MAHDFQAQLTFRPWRETEFQDTRLLPFGHWEERFVWAYPSKPGYTFSYYKSANEYGNEEWIIMWNEKPGELRPELVWRVM